jgi:hypothetical protein
MQNEKGKERKRKGPFEVVVSGPVTPSLMPPTCGVMERVRVRVEVNGKGLTGKWNRKGKEKC